MADRHSVVLPMPGSPSATKPAGSDAAAARNAITARPSSGRLTTRLGTRSVSQEILLYAPQTGIFALISDERSHRAVLPSSRFHVCRPSLWHGVGPLLTLRIPAHGERSHVRFESVPASREPGPPLSPVLCRGLSPSTVAPQFPCGADVSGIRVDQRI